MNKLQDSKKTKTVDIAAIFDRIVNEQSMREYYYELTFLISPSASDKEKEELLEWLNKEIASLGVVIDKTLPREINLAYPIKKEQRAFLTTIKFEGDKSKIEQLKQNLEKQEKILRFLLIKNVKRAEKSKPSQETQKPSLEKEPPKEKKETKKKEKKVELEEIEKKLENVLQE